ncbi:MAG: hypothetical protein ABFC98_03130 [Candidatus Cloacimonas sp.]
MRAYKVFEKSNNFYVSNGAGLGQNDTLLLTYHQGEIIIALQGTIGIFIFKRYDDALRYGGQFYILEIETLAPIKPVTKVVSNLHHLYGDVFKLATYKKTLVPVGQQNYIVPANSFLCRKIKVIGLAKERC